ncbi:hypothetical protein [Serratia marcescens]|nr:hypothetical protein [Serratia marcescens]
MKKNDTDVLAAWNLLASSAGWASIVPINWGTVFGLMLVIING